MQSAPTLEAAVALFRDGKLEEARQTAQARVAVFPDDANALHLLGVIAYQLGEDESARELLRCALSLLPTNWRVRMMLGHAHRRLGELDQALDNYRYAQMLEPASAEASWYLGLVERDTGANFAAALDYLRASLLQPENDDAVQGLLEALKAALRARQVPVPNREAVRGGFSSALISFIICSVDEQKFRRVNAEIHRAMSEHCYEVVGIHNARSLCQGYNLGASASHGQVLVFCHDDIEILDGAFRQRLLRALSVNEVVGVAGTTRMKGSAWSHSGQPYMHGWVVHPNSGAEPFGLSISALGPAVATGIQALDGVFMAMRRGAYEQIRFDEATFTGFHFYDLDFCYRAYQAGLRIAVVRDLLIQHFSYGSPDEAWHRYANLFLAKHPELRTEALTRPGHYFLVKLASLDELHTYCAALRELLTQCNALIADAGLPADDPRRQRANLYAEGTGALA